MSVQAIELVVTLLFIISLRRWPRFMGILSLLVALLLGYIFNRTFALGGVGTVSGAKITGKQTMSAAIYDRDAEGGVRMANIAVPDHTQAQLLIQVKAAALNPSNYKVVYAHWPFLRHIKDYVIGYDVAGIVLSKGTDPSCAAIKIKDEVFGLTFSGTLAQYAVVPCERVARKPKMLSFEQAAGLPVVALTTLQAYQFANLTKGQNVLVVGASGGCGIYGVTMAKAAGARVTGICSSKNIDFVKSLGADELVDYTNATAMAQLLASGPTFDVVYDTVTSFDPVDPDYEPIVRPLVKKGGAYVAINGAVSDFVRGIVRHVFKLGSAIERPGYHLLIIDLDHAKLDLATLADMFDRGELKDAPIGVQIKLDSDAALQTAWKQIQSRRTTGKIVLTL